MRLAIAVAATVTITVCPTASAGTLPVPDLLASRTAYSSIPQIVPGNVASLGFEATSTAEFGDEVGLSPGRRVLHSLRVVMSSQRCQTRTSPGNVCVTTPGSYFTHPITANIYAVDGSTGTPRPG